MIPLTPYPLLLAAPLIGLAVNVLAQVIALRASGGRRFNRSIVIGLLANAASTAALTWLASPAKAVDAALLLPVNLATATALGVCYWNFLNLNITSLRIRMLKALRRAPGGEMTGEALAAMHHPCQMLEQRLARLAAKEQIRLENGRYYAQGTWIVAIMRIIGGLRRIILPGRL